MNPQQPTTPTPDQISVALTNQVQILANEQLVLVLLLIVLGLQFTLVGAMVFAAVFSVQNVKSYVDRLEREAIQVIQLMAKRLEREKE